MNSSEQRILITGAAGGIGAALARRLAAAGRPLMLTDLKADALTDLAKALGGDTIPVAADIGFAADRERLCRRAREAGVNALVNVAGVNPFGLFAEQTAAEIETALCINTAAPMLLCHGMMPVLASRTEARIVNVGSTFGAIGFPGFCVYSASKYAVRGFTEALRRELADSSISVHYVAPRATRTALNTDRVHALNEALGVATDSPETVARAIERALEGRREVYVGLPERIFALINAVLPAVIDRALVRRLPTIRRYATRRPPPAASADQPPTASLQV